VPLNHSRRILLLLSAAVTGHGQPMLALKDALDLALRTHPLLEAGAARAEAASGLLMQSGLRPNPRLVFQLENLRPSGVLARDTDSFAYLVKPIETGGKRERRVEAAEAGVRRTELEREVLARLIAGRVKQAYWTAAGAAQVHRLLIDTATNFRLVVEYHEARLREGAVAEADLLRVKLENERLAVSINSAALDAERARIVLFREMGRTDFPAVTLAELTGGTTAPAAPADLAPALEARPDVRLARQVLEQMRANARLQRANARPDLEALFGYKRTAGFNTAIGGVQWNLPWTNRNQGSIAAADAEIRVAESELAATLALAQAEIQSAGAEVRMRRDQLDRLFGGVDGGGLRGMAAESARIALAAYREGGADLLRLLDAERVRIELQVLYVRTLAEYRQSVAALETALGVNP
jgi:cobalt-zinc-cadmium efflux system outer membrane protein